jgi:hypothetical protein
MRSFWIGLRDLSLAAALPFWGAVGGGVGLVVMALAQGWLSPLVGVLVGIIVALAIDHINLRRRLRAIEGRAHPNIVVHSASSDVRLLYETNRIGSEPKITPRGFVSVVAVTFMNDPIDSSEEAKATDVVAEVTFRKERF